MCMKWRISLTLVVLTLGTASCRQKMADQPAYRPLQYSDFWGDARSGRDPVPGTVARGQLKDDEAYYTGKRDGEFVNVVPGSVDRKMLERGRERFDIFCAPCHDRLGEGRGMVVRRGFPQPPSLHIDRLREARPGYVFDVITRGFGRQPDLASQIPVPDRWAIVAYMKVLQFSQHAPLDAVPTAERRTLEAAPAAGKQDTPGGAGGEKP
jgi:cbb3-type cytochrome c oxidase subunit III